MPSSPRTRTLLLFLALLALAAVPVAAADDEDGACIHQRGTTGFTVTVAHCVPSTQDVRDRVQDFLERPPS